MNLPLIGITTYHRDERGYTQLPGEYADAVRRAGGLPLLLQPGEQHIDQLLDLLDGIILSGGGDVDPQRYTPESSESGAEVYWVDQERDDFEFALAKRLIERADRPTLGICRGMQIINVASGGSLIQHIPAAMPNAIDHRQPPDKPYGPIPHHATLTPSSHLAEVMESETVLTASWHHQAIERVAPGFQVVATASDGIIEAIELPSQPWLMAVQWHPELTAAEDVAQQKLFDELVAQAKKRRDK